MSRPLQILYIHAEEDTPLREALEKQLAVLARSGMIEGCSSDSLLPGSRVEAEVDRLLAAADLLLPLVSADLFASDRGHALLDRALRRHQQEGIPLLPILVRPVLWQDSALAGLRPLPRGGKPVTSWDRQDEAWLEVAQGLRVILSGLAGGAPHAVTLTIPARQEDPLEPIRILHLSDLHIDAGSDADALLQPLAADLRDREGLAVEALDLLVVSGDLSNTAAPKELACAHNFLTKLTKSFGLDPSRVAVVPGNHDLSWSTPVYDYKEGGKVDVRKLPAGSYLQEGSGFLVRNDKKYPRRFENFTNHLWEPLCGKPYPQSAEEQGMSSLSADGRIQLLLLNSSWQIDKRHPQRSSILDSALTRALNQADADLKAARAAGRIAPAARPLRIAVWHHPVTGNEKMSEDAFLERLQQADVRLCLHGHVHEVRADLVGYTHPTRRMHIIGAGSFGAPAKDRPESTPALYNLIEVEPSLRRAKVHTRGRARRGGAFTGHAIWPGSERNTFRAWYEVDLGDSGWSAGRGAAPEPGPSAAKREEGGDDRRRERAAQVEAAVADLLARRPRVAAALAEKLKITAAGDAVARVVAKAIVHQRPAKEVARAVNHVDADLARTSADPADWNAIRELLFQILPLAIDWRALVDQGARGAAIELPLASATIAEIVVAGIDERLCKFAECAGPEMPVGAAAIRAPAAARAPFFDVDGAILVEAVVRHVAEKTSVKSASYEKLREEVEGHLRYHGSEAPDAERLPYYLLFEEDTLGQGEAAQSRWALARSRIPTELPSLRLVRLEGGSPAEERTLAEHIRAILNRTL